MYIFIYQLFVNASIEASVRTVTGVNKGPNNNYPRFPPKLTLKYSMAQL